MQITEFVDRDEYLVEMAHGKTILHLGCIGLDGGFLEEEIVRSLHAELTNVSDVLGVDIREDVVVALKENGFFDNIVVGDVEQLETLKIDREFDYIFSTDVIEHLSNPGRMLDGMMRFDTTVILTTPNAFGLMNFIRYALRRFKDESEHVMTFNRDNLVNILKRHGYRAVEMKTCHHPNARNKRFFKVARAFLRKFPRFGGTLLVKAVPLSNGTQN